jgi:hypothetical protein
VKTNVTTTLQSQPDLIQEKKPVEKHVAIIMIKLGQEDPCGKECVGNRGYLKIFFI